MDFPPSVQITGDLSGGRRKNGMMAGRLDHDHDGGDVWAAVKGGGDKRNEGRKVSEEEKRKKYFVQTRTDDAFTITPVRGAAEQSISEAAERPPQTLPPPPPRTSPLSLYFIAK